MKHSAVKQRAARHRPAMRRLRIASPRVFDGLLGRLLKPNAPSELAFIGGVTVVAVLGLICLLAGYTMYRGDPKAWRAILPVGLIGLVLGIIGPGGALGIFAGGIAAIGGYIGREV